MSLRACMSAFGPQIMARCTVLRHYSEGRDYSPKSIGDKLTVWTEAPGIWFVVAIATECGDGR
jgi:hypothetical protein